MRKLTADFYRKDAVTLARELLGKVICTVNDGVLTSGIISETEAYMGAVDRASHAFGGRRTARTEIIYSQGGCAYVYLIYGMYYCMNVVANEKNVPEAVLIRAVIPENGVDVMHNRRMNKGRMNNKGICIPLSKLADGPGKLCDALGITKAHNGLSLLGDTIFICECGYAPDKDILEGKRINIDYAGEDADKKWRFSLNPNDSLWKLKTGISK